MGRYTIDLGEKFEELLRELSREKGVTKSEVIRRAVASYGYLVRQSIAHPGTKVSITTADDKVMKDVVLP